MCFLYVPISAASYSISLDWMEYLVIISLMGLVLSALLSPCASTSQIEVQSFHQKQGISLCLLCTF